MVELGMSSLAWGILVFFFTASCVMFWLFGKKIGAAKEYERIAARSILLGKDPIPMRLKGISFRILSVKWLNRGKDYRSCVYICEPSSIDQYSEIIVFERWIKKGGKETFLHEGKIFQLSESGELEFNR